MARNQTHPLPPPALFANIHFYHVTRLNSNQLCDNKQKSKDKTVNSPLPSPPLISPQLTHTQLLLTENFKDVDAASYSMFFSPVDSFVHSHFSLAHTERETVGDESWNRLSLSLSLTFLDRGESENFAEFHCSIKTPFRSVFLWILFYSLWAFKLSRWINICMYIF